MPVEAALKQMNNFFFKHLLLVFKVFLQIVKDIMH